MGNATFEEMVKSNVGMLEGVTARVQHALGKGEEFTQELVNAAVTHWFQTRQDLCEELLENKTARAKNMRHDIALGLWEQARS